MTKPGPQDTQSTARSDELEPAGPISDAELASAIVGGEAPVAARRAKRASLAYTAEPVVDERKILTIA